MSSTEYTAHACHCSEPKLGIVDGDTDTIYCDNCDGAISAVSEVVIEQHSRFDADHYRHCQDCYEDHLDFMQEQEMDARSEASEYNNEEEDYA